MTAGQRDLFAMNAHGDIWHEPELFDAPASWTVSAPARAHHLSEWSRAGELDSRGMIRITAECLVCRPDVGEGGRTFIARAPTESQVWRELERMHAAYIDAHRPAPPAPEPAQGSLI